MGFGIFFILEIVCIIITESSGKSVIGNECSEHYDCPVTKPACFDSICMNLCENACGINAICELRDRLTPVCYCPAEMIGDPFYKCMTPDVTLIYCEGHSDCLGDNYQCVGNRCIDPCIACGENAMCIIRNEEPVCVCQNNMTGDPYVSCESLASDVPDE